MFLMTQKSYQGSKDLMEQTPRKKVIPVFSPIFGTIYILKALVIEEAGAEEPENMSRKPQQASAKKNICQPHRMRRKILKFRARRRL